MLTIVERATHARRLNGELQGRLRDECLNEHLFRSYRHAREIIEDWRIDYKLNRPHTSLNGLAPNEIATRSRIDHNVKKANL